jgi:hypothetical protein
MKGKKRAYNTAKYSDLAVIDLIKFLLIHANQVTNWLITYPFHITNEKLLGIIGVVIPHLT